MDYLDTQKQFRHRIILLVGYVLVAIAIIVGTAILVQVAYGFGLGKNGTVIQNGSAYFSSQPHPASIYVNGVLNPHKTNTRLYLPGDIYHIKLSRPGYRDWQRIVTVNGGMVEHFDYPLLFPTKLISKTDPPYAVSPALATQSPDRRWLLVLQPNSNTNFDLYDLKNPTNAPIVVTLPSTTVTKATSSESWQLGEWADDNQHVLLKHNYDGKTEFILLDRANPGQSLNLTQTLGLADSATLTLDNKKYDQYYIYNSADQSLQTATLSSHTPTPVLAHVLAYQTYASNIVLYVTDDGAAAGKVVLKLLSSGQTYSIHQLPANTSYVLDLTEYSSTLYVVAGAASENKVYIYNDPIGQFNSNAKNAVVPVRVLHVMKPNYVSFSTNAQFIVAENGQQFAIYDIENNVGYNYTDPAALDAPQAHATWMDGDRLTYVSNGKLSVLDYDGTNQQSLMPAASGYMPFFAPDYSFIDTLAPTSSAGQATLSQTSLFTPADQ